MYLNISKIIDESIKKVLYETTVDKYGQMDMFDDMQWEIEPTVEWMKTKYDEFNKMYFNNELPPCYLKVGALPDNTLGRFHRNKNVLLHTLGGNIYFDSKNDRYWELNKDNYFKLVKPTITLNSKYKAKEKDLENTLIHEMCHYYTCFEENGNGRSINPENNGHGEDFNNIAQKIFNTSKGNISIEQIANAEVLKGYKATALFNNKGFKVCVFNYEGDNVFMWTREKVWIKIAAKRFGTLKITENPTLIMLLKRYNYPRQILSNPNWRVYSISNAPEIIQKTFRDSDYANITVDDIPND